MNNDQPKKDAEITEKAKLEAMEDLEKRRLEALAELDKAAMKSPEDPIVQLPMEEKIPIALTKTEKKLFLYHSSEHRAMEDAAAAQIRQLGNTIKLNLIEQFAQEHGLKLEPGQYRFNQETMAFIDWPLPPKARMPDPRILSGAGSK